MKLISVIIATYNRAPDLEKVIKGLLAQELPGSFDYEMIIIDNGSTDNTENTVKDLMEHAKGRLNYFRQSTPGKSNALNMGIAHAKGEIIAFTDDDVTVEKNWLSSIAASFDLYRCDGIGGRVLPVYPENTPSWVSQNPVQMAGVVVIYDQGDTAYPANTSMERFIGSNWAFKSSVFKECGLFRTDLGPGTPMIVGEDEEFYYRLLKMNKDLYYCPQVIIRHPVDIGRLSWGRMANWHMALGRYLAYKQIQQGKDGFICYGEIPRYIIKIIVMSSLKLLVQFPDRLKSWNTNRELFCSIGMAQQYWKSKGHK